MYKVVAFIQAPSFGGPHNQILQLNDYLVEHNFRYLAVVTDVNGSAYKRLSLGDIPCRVTPITRFRRTLNIMYYLKFFFLFPVEIWKIRKILKEEQADVVQVCGFLNLQPAIAARTLNIPVVWQILSDYTPKPLRIILSPFIKLLSNSIMSTGDFVAKKHPGIMTHSGYLKFFPPVDIERFKPNESVKKASRVTLNAEEGDIIVGTIGNFSKQKSHEVLINAFRNVREKYPKTRLRILGSYIDTNRDYYEKEVKDLAKKYDLLKNGECEFIEVGNRVETLIQGLDIFVLSSVSEGVPTVMLEAMAVSLPIVSTDVGSIKEYIPDLNFLVDVGDSEMLAERISLLVENENARKRSSNASLNLAVNNYNKENCGKIHLRAFEIAMSK